MNREGRLLGQMFISSIYLLQVRKAAYQSLGPFISTFYVPNSETPSPENTSLDLLGDSVLVDNSLVESSALTTTGNSSTEDSNSENRHPLPNPPDQLFSNSSTPIHSNGQGNDKGSTSAQRDAESGSQFSNFEFWRSPIPKVEGDGKVDKLAESLENLSLEDVEDSPGSKPTESQGGCAEGDESGKERLGSGKDELKSGVIQGKLDFDDRTDCRQGTEGTNTVQVDVGAEKISEEQKQIATQSEAESKVTEESDGKDVQDTQSSSSRRSDEPSLGDDDAQRSMSAPHSSEHQSTPSSTTTVEVTSTPPNEDSTESTSPGSTTSSVSSNGPPTEPPPRLSETTREDSRRGADVAIAADDAMRIRSCSAGSSLRTELGSNLMFEEEKRGSGETKKRRWSLDKMNKLQENNNLPPVSSRRYCVWVCGCMCVCLLAST